MGPKSLKISVQGEHHVPVEVEGDGDSPRRNRQAQHWPMGNVGGRSGEYSRLNGNRSWR